MRRDTPEYIKQLTKKLRNHPTIAEQELWSRIRNKQLGGYRFLRQYVIGRYIADFYCDKAKVVIEIDGKVHENDGRKEYDRIRDEAIKTYEIRIIRFTNDEVSDNIAMVLEKLLSFLEHK